MNFTGMGIADMNENTMRNDLIMRTKINPLAVNSKGTISEMSLILERFSDSFKLFAYLDMLRADSLTCTAFYTLRRDLMPLAFHVPIMAPLCQRIILVQRVHVQCPE